MPPPLGMQGLSAGSVSISLGAPGEVGPHLLPGFPVCAFHLSLGVLGSQIGATTPRLLHVGWNSGCFCQVLWPAVPSPQPSTVHFERGLLVTMFSKTGWLPSPRMLSSQSNSGFINRSCAQLSAWVLGLQTQMLTRQALDPLVCLPKALFHFCCWNPAPVGFTGEPDLLCSL